MYRDILRSQLNRAKQTLTELKSHLKNMNSNNNPNHNHNNNPNNSSSVGLKTLKAKIKSISDRVNQLEFQVENNKMIILRQKSIQGFYKEPSKGYVYIYIYTYDLSLSLSLY